MRWRTLKQKQHQHQPHSNAPIPFARIPDKLKAFITDMFMIYIPILYIITYLFLDGKESFQASTFAPLIGVVLYGLIDAIFIYKTGQTPGKKAYDIKVVSLPHLEQISFLKAVWRFTLFILSSATIFALLVPLFREDRRTLHDLLTHTILIKINT